MKNEVLSAPHRYKVLLIGIYFAPHRYDFAPKVLLSVYFLLLKYDY